MTRSSGHPRVVFLCGSTKFRSNRNRMTDLTRALVELYRTKNGVVIFAEYAGIGKPNRILVQRRGYQLVGKEQNFERLPFETRSLRELCDQHRRQDLILVTNFWDYQRSIKELDPQLPNSTLGIIYFDVETQKEVLQPVPKDPKFKEALRNFVEARPLAGRRLIIKKPIQGVNEWKPRSTES